MIISSAKFAKLLLGVFVIALMLCFSFNPATYMQATYQGVVVWTTAVLPALFPFFFLTNILTTTNILNKPASFLSRPLRFFYNTPKVSSIVFVLSIISGYPVGAKLISDLYKSKQIDKYEAVRINAFTSCSGPIFIIGTVGTKMLGKPDLGLTLFLIHFLGALINGFIYRNYGKNFKNNINTFVAEQPVKDILGNAIKQSVLSILIVGGYIAISFLICNFLIETNILKLITTPLSCLLKPLGIQTEFANGIVLGITEITRGCFEFSQLSTLDLRTVTILCSFVISFGGLSVMLQSMTYLKECGIKTKIYLLQKLTQAISTTTVAFLITTI